jgi:hypothetical protein
MSYYIEPSLSVLVTRIPFLTPNFNSLGLFSHIGDLPAGFYVQGTFTTVNPTTRLKIKRADGTWAFITSEAIVGSIGFPGTDAPDNDSFFSPPNQSIIPAYLGGSGTEYEIGLIGNQDDLDFTNAGTLRCNNPSLLTIRGLKAGIPGQLLVITSVGAGQVDINNQDTNSVSGNRIINGIIGIRSLAAGYGKCLLKYDGIALRWRIIAHSQGIAINVPYSAGNFTANTGTWTVGAGDQTGFSYFLRDSILEVFANLDATSVTGTPAYFKIANPAGYLGLIDDSGIIIIFDNSGSVASVARAFTSNGQTFIGIARLDGAALQNATDNTYIRLHYAFPIQ